ncbi:MAG: hypothetical protein JG763_2159 [Shewanella sp.]|jgi:hypothetical protein|uniref:hypothetical protein n=1 Tax=Shewanella sp. TaxID=50422 RepID=UPI001EB50A7B|nr:hypothetical protein [Shewanella sp.]MBZ4679530.1 hypothetical protein [Shewanella sp.]
MMIKQTGHPGAVQSLSQAVAGNRPPESAQQIIETKDEILVSPSRQLLEFDSQALNDKYQQREQLKRETAGHSDAIALYLHTQHAAQRDAISAMVGIDVYA